MLVHAFPEADIPVVQLSINATEPFDYHLELGAKLAPLRERGVLVVGSGNVVHNLRLIDWAGPTTGFDWAHAFDDEAAEVMGAEPRPAGSAAEPPGFTQGGAHARPLPAAALPRRAGLGRRPARPGWSRATPWARCR